MRNFLKENPHARLIIASSSALLGLFLIVFGWKMTGDMAGLLIMIIGLILLLTALFVYNEAFKDSKKKFDREIKNNKSR